VSVAHLRGFAPGPTHQDCNPHTSRTRGRRFTTCAISPKLEKVTKILQFFVQDSESTKRLVNLPLSIPDALFTTRSGLVFLYNWLIIS